MTAKPAADYVIQKWTVAGDSVSDAPVYTLTVPAANVEAVAHFAIPKVYFVSEGVTVCSVDVPAGKTVTPPVEPTRNDYIFLGWYNGDVLWDFSSPVTTAALVLTARWVSTSVGVYTVTFDAAGGLPVPQVQKVTGNEKTSEPQVSPYKPGAGSISLYT
ncbi:MAG: InlB B-repeat-containing protein [Dysgonamonadaceae bacterium]|nr:InlB B-repeat-containing protein [Dysgonamonadaceae bacterium]